MVESDEFQNPIAWDEIDVDDYDGLILPGGHAEGMKPYLESAAIQRAAADFMQARKPVAAICHGVVVLARSTDENGNSVLQGRRATCLLESQEMAAFNMTRLWLGKYYRTYDQTVEAEVREALGDEGAFEDGPFALLRDTPERPERGFVVRDENLLTARWPGDAHRFSHEFVEMLGV